MKQLTYGKNTLVTQKCDCSFKKVFTLLCFAQTELECVDQINENNDLSLSIFSTRSFCKRRQEMKTYSLW
jgi:hypothetical protein